MSITSVSNSALAAKMAADAAAEQAAEDARVRVQRIQDQAQAERAEAAAQADRIRREGNDQVEQERVRSSAAVESQKIKGYEGVLEIQKRQESELQRMKSKGDKDLTETDWNYKNQLERKTRDGEQKIKTAEKEHQLRAEIEQKTADAEFAQRKFQNENQLKQLQDSHDHRFKSVASAELAEEQKLREKSVTGRMEAEKRFNEQYATNLKTYGDSLKHLDGANQKQLFELRHSQERKLNEYSSKAKDPFYQPVRFQSEMKDTPGAYVLTVKIPEYEQKDITVNVNDGRILLTGQRKTTMKRELEDGRVVGTSSYQTYHESFPIQDAVDAKELRREFDGDRMTITLPKRAGIVPNTPYQKKPV